MEKGSNTLFCPEEYVESRLSEIHAFLAYSLQSKSESTREKRWREGLGSVQKCVKNNKEMSFCNLRRLCFIC